VKWKEEMYLHKETQRKNFAILAQPLCVLCVKDFKHISRSQRDGFTKNPQRKYKRKARRGYLKTMVR